MNNLYRGVCLGLLAAGMVIMPTAQAGSAPTAAAPGDGTLIQQLRDDARGDVVTSRKSATGKVGFVRAQGGAAADLLPSANADDKASAAAKARSFLREYAGLFGARSTELISGDVSKSALGWNVSFTQRYQGVPVFGSGLRAQLDAQGDLVSVNGYVAPGLDLGVTPRLSAAEAGRRAVAEVKSDPPGHDGAKADVSGLTAKRTELSVYRKGVTRGDVGEAVLVYVVEVTNGANVRDMVFMDARTGKPVNRYSLIHEGLYRELYEGNTNRSNRVWAEGEALPGDLNEEQQNLVAATGESYWFFANTFEQDSWDGLGATMTTVNNDPRINCPNANWNGTTTNYCNGVTSDDVVAHEWGHAYTEGSWDGIYQWQPGALNESYSDIWGETIDLINGRQDEEEGDIEAPRPVGQCSTHSPAQPLFTINSPAPIAKDCDTAGASFGPQLDDTGVTSDIVVGLDADEDGDGDPNPFDLQGGVYDGCSPFTNAAALVGKIVMVNRGLCGFEVKARNVDAAGGIGAVIANRDPEVFAMSGDADPDPDISTVMISRTDWQSISTTLTTSTVNVTMKDASGPRTDSYRWLMGEDSFAFGGAIRDMWTPTCHGDPGKVSDAEYKCGTDDGGGVHSNSGVPNHAYALLVDGGTYNGTTVTGIGLAKAAHIYYYAMQLFQTPTTDFVDHADSLEATCDLLIEEEVDIYELTTAEGDVPAVEGVMEAADCAELTKAIAAVELRAEPVQCNFQPLLEQGGPSLCGAGTTTTTQWTETFEDGLAGWDKDNEVVYSGGGSLPWSSDSSAPGGRTGTVARGDDNPDAGDCTEGAGDFSSRDSIISPVIQMPATLSSPKLTFDHYVATEFEFDGGNVKVSVNGEPFEVIPATAYLFNAPATELAATNPLEGELGFTGSDGGVVSGSWGTSIVDLDELGVAGGDTVTLRFDFGRDGCGGLDGWYLDNVKIVTCDVEVPGVATIAGTHNPEPSAYGAAHKVDVTVGGADGAGTGTVTVKEGATTLGTAPLAAGAASVSLPATMKPGAHALTVEYSGDSNYAAGTDSVTATVAKATGTISAKAKPKKVKPGAIFRTKIVITGPVGLARSGDVVVSYKGQKLGEGTIGANGRITIRLPADFKPGKKITLTAKFLGNSDLGALITTYDLKMAKK